MEEARAVLTRIRRIEALERERAGVRAVLAEVERLIAETGAWLVAEGGEDGAAASLERLRTAVELRREAMIPM